MRTANCEQDCRQGFAQPFPQPLRQAQITRQPENEDTVFRLPFIADGLNQCTHARADKISFA
ncbi:hypothetical protein, partial [Kingella oralis]|uniref:hypothetical protein n=1 Tax=Kingella oralis TaxID=505 RepID=UPI003C6FDD4A